MRFTIRDLLWLTVVVAFGVSWWLDRSKLAEELSYLSLSTTDLSRLPGLVTPSDIFLPDPSAPATNLPSD
jgi:hypothetical protein